jgi:2-dehydro-3-deoxyphosphooctonate aldolase (KDO 8-P synthase)
MKDLIIIAGPCVVESRELTTQIAEKLDEIIKNVGLSNYVFKASYKKANRTKIDSFVGIDEDEALKILASLRTRPVMTDVHESTDCKKMNKYVHILQIPAFLCRQTGLILAAAETTGFINIKKGQWMHPEQMKYAVEKAKSINEHVEVWVTERGSSFGYSHNVVDMTSIPIMKKFADKVIVDCTHSVQIPNSGSTTGGNPEMIETIALAAVAAGADGLFFEVHPNPVESLSDSGSILNINKLQSIIERCIRVRKAIYI